MRSDRRFLPRTGFTGHRVVSLFCFAALFPESCVYYRLVLVNERSGSVQLQGHVRALVELPLLFDAALVQRIVNCPVVQILANDCDLALLQGTDRLH